MAKRKPTSNNVSKRVSAEIVLNKFTTDNNMVLALGQPKIDISNDGLVIVGKPNILVFYKDELSQRPTKAPKTGKPLN